MAAIGIVFVVLGFIIINAWGLPNRYLYNKWDYIGSFIGVLGLLLIMISIVTIVWRYLP
jgi:drug/metabolite transporter superfamily protein YnfA